MHIITLLKILVIGSDISFGTQMNYTHCLVTLEHTILALDTIHLTPFPKIANFLEGRDCFIFPREQEYPSLSQHLIT